MLFFQADIFRNAIVCARAWPGRYGAISRERVLGESLLSRIALVYVDLALHAVDRVFHYAVPPGMNLLPGQAVRVPFGRRQVPGLVVGFAAESPVSELKEIAEILYFGEQMITAEQLKLAGLLAEYYFAPLSLILRQMLPFRLSLDQRRWPRPKTTAVLVPLVERVPESLSERAQRQRQLLATLIERGELPLSEAGSYSAAKQLEKKGLARIVLMEQRRAPLIAQLASSTQPFQLTADQQIALQELTRSLESGETQSFLLHGVTGSGKTEVYLQLIKVALEAGLQSLVLVPEIALTPQMVERFSARFGSQVAVWHSGLSPGERFDEWQRIRTGEARIVVGARSAIFSPFDRLGVIILDEEHDNSYRQDENPRYQTRVVAQLRQRTSGCLLVMGSATPSLETYYASETGRCRRLELPRRVMDQELPTVRVVDMRDEYRSGHSAPVSRRLEYELRQCLGREEQAIILLNRRGYANFLLCPDCGHVPFCSHCDISLTYHRRDGQLRCHYCGWAQPVLQACPACGSAQLKQQGFGTERLENYLQEILPEARIGRMDADTMAERNAHTRLLEAFGRGDYDILLGTQMIAKGLDFPRVTLVGVVGADLGLYIPDFRSSERTFQLLTQVAGRAGRAHRAGQVVVQTFSPEHYVIDCARHHDYLRFYQQEIKLRQHAGYPPLGYMITLLLTNENESKLAEDAGILASLLREELGPAAGLIGPAPAGVSKIRDSYRWQIIVKSRQRVALRRGVQQAMDRYYARGCRTHLVLDFDA
jgi:primosomal protein N' (replication factor Y)